MADADLPRVSSGGVSPQAFFAGGPDNQVHFEGYQVSNQCMALVRDECLLPCKDAPELGYAKESSSEQYVPDVFYKVKMQRCGPCPAGAWLVLEPSGLEAVGQPCLLKFQLADRGIPQSFGACYPLLRLLWWWGLNPAVETTCAGFAICTTRPSHGDTRHFQLLNLGGQCGRAPVWAEGWSSVVSNCSLLRALEVLANS